VRRCALAGSIAALVLAAAGCGGGDDGASKRAAATQTTPTTTTTRAPRATERDRVSSCLTGLRYRLSGGATMSTDPSQAEYQIVFEGRSGGGYIGFYKNQARAKRVAVQLRRNASRVNGAGAENHGAINIVWIDMANQTARSSVRACLVD
jgi:hypothetical protein